MFDKEIINMDVIYMENIREINEEEKKDLLEYYTEELGRDKEGSEALIESYIFVTIEGYMSDSPGYAGKVIFALYGQPQLYEVYIYEDEKIKRQKSERELILEGKLEE